MNESRLVYGTSSWSTKGWVGPFYPPGTKPADFLSYYATQFSSVEADTSYYRVPTRELVRGWNAKTPDGFVLSAKFPRTVVHGGESEAPDASRMFDAGETARFLEVMAELGAKCGPLVLQFPYFNQGAYRTLRAFLDRLEPFLASLPPSFRYALEVRNKAWLVPELTAVLQKHRVALVLVDLAYMPHPADLQLDPVTTDFSYVRLVGDRKAVEAQTQTFDRLVLDQDERLARWAAYIRERLPHGKVYVYANNHFAGHGPETIRGLARLLEERQET